MTRSVMGKGLVVIFKVKMRTQIREKKPQLSSISAELLNLFTADLFTRTICPYFVCDFLLYCTDFSIEKKISLLLLLVFFLGGVNIKKFAILANPQFAESHLFAFSEMCHAAAQFMDFSDRCGT